MLSDVEALRRRRPDLLVGVICDGAREMWNLLDGAVAQAELEGSVRRLVDLWHLLGYAGKALRVRYDEGRASTELARWKLRLLNQSGAARRLLDELRSWNVTLRSRRVGDEQPVQEAITYLSNQLDAGRVDYAAARRAGQPVGSDPSRRRARASSACASSGRALDGSNAREVTSCGCAPSRRADDGTPRWNCCIPRGFTRSRWSGEQDGKHTPYHLRRATMVRRQRGCDICVLDERSEGAFG